MNWHSPFLLRFVDGQINDLDGRSFIGKDLAISYDLCCFRFCDRDKLDDSAFLLVEALSSRDSASSLAAFFDGTMDSSEFLSAFMSDFPSETFSDRSIDAIARWLWHKNGNQQDLPVLAIEMSTHAQGHRLRRVRNCLANAATAM